MRYIVEERPGIGNNSVGYIVDSATNTTVAVAPNRYVAETVCNTKNIESLLARIESLEEQVEWLKRKLYDTKRE